MMMIFAVEWAIYFLNALFISNRLKYFHKSYTSKIRYFGGKLLSLTVRV